MGLHGPAAQVPYWVLASEYLDALEAGQFPGKLLRDRYGLSERAWDHRRTWMSQQGWLPKGDPQRGPRLQDAAWVAAARAQLRERLRRDIRIKRAVEEARLERAEAAAQRRAATEAARAGRCERPARAPRVAKQPKRSGPEPVTEIYL